MNTTASQRETIVQGTMLAVLAAAALFVAGHVVWWSFANTETILGGVVVSVLLLLPSAALCSIVATPLAGLIGFVAAALLAALDLILHRV